MRKIPSPDSSLEPAEKARTGVSRRVAIGAMAAFGAGAACLTAQRAAAQSKQKQTDVAYQSSPKDGNQCDKCALFQPPDACMGVEGKISPSGWCNIYSPKA